MTRTPFLINVEEGVLEDLGRRLRRTRWTGGPRDDTWAFGTSPDYLREFVAYWLDQFDWRKAERSLNQLSQFKVELDGTSLHFVHEKARGQARMPLLLLHGWPDSFYRYCQHRSDDGLQSRAEVSRGR
jgi:hypothetical protein